MSRSDSGVKVDGVCNACDCWGCVKVALDVRISLYLLFILSFLGGGITMFCLFNYSFSCLVFIQQNYIAE